MMPILFFVKIELFDYHIIECYKQESLTIVIRKKDDY